MVGGVEKREREKVLHGNVEFCICLDAFEIKRSENRFEWMGFWDFLRRAYLRYIEAEHMQIVSTYSRTIF